MAHGTFCTCKRCYKSAYNAGIGKGGMHVGRPHTSKNDPRVHVTLSIRNGAGKKVQKDQHRSNLGAIAYGQTAYEASRGRRNKGS